MEYQQTKTFRLIPKLERHTVEDLNATWHHTDLEKFFCPRFLHNLFVNDKMY